MKKVYSQPKVRLIQCQSYLCSTSTTTTEDLIVPPMGRETTEDLDIPPMGGY